MILNSLVVILLIIVLDFLMGVLTSIKNKTFKFSKMPQFVATNIFPYVGGLCVIALMAIYVTEMEYLYYTAAGLVGLKFSKEALVDKMIVLFK